MRKFSVLLIIMTLSLPAFAQTNPQEITPEDAKRCTERKFSQIDYDIALFLSGDPKFAARQAWVFKDQSPECRVFRGEPPAKKN